jgi:hypothetical protein
MVRMVRKQVYIAPEQDALLKRRAKELGMSESDLIRWGIEQLSHVRPTRYLDEQAWQDELARIEERGRLPAVEGTRSWTREELYDDRLDRFSR